MAWPGQEHGADFNRFLPTERVGEGVVNCHLAARLLILFASHWLDTGLAVLREA